MVSECPRNIMMTKSSLDNFCRFAEEGPAFVNHKSLPGVTDIPSQIIITQVAALRRRFFPPSLLFFGRFLFAGGFGEESLTVC